MVFSKLLHNLHAWVSGHLHHHGDRPNDREQLLPDKPSRAHGAPATPVSHPVTFSNTCSVVLIPSRQEYFDAGIILWYGEDELAVAQREIANEIDNVLYDHPELSIDTAMSYLYQPRHADERCSTCPMPSAKYKERLHVLVVHPDTAAYQRVAQAIHQALLPMDHWALTLQHASSREAALGIIAAVPNALDVVVLFEHLFLNCSEDKLTGLLDCIHTNNTQRVLVGLLMKNRCPCITCAPAGPTIAARRGREEIYGRMSASSEETVEHDLRAISADSVDSHATVSLYEAKDQAVPEFCIAVAKDPLDRFLHAQAEEYKLDFLWREPVGDIVQMLPLLLADRRHPGESSKRNSLQRNSLRRLSSPPKMVKSPTGVSVGRIVPANW